MPDTPLGITYPDSSAHTRLWEHFQTLAADVDALLGTSKTQSGEASIPFSGQSTQSVAVSFPAAFGGVPNVVASAANVGINVSVQSITSTGFTLFGRRIEDGATQGAAVTVQWIARGPR